MTRVLSTVTLIESFVLIEFSIINTRQVSFFFGFTFNDFVFAVFDFDGEGDTKDTVNSAKMGKSVGLNFTQVGSVIIVLFNGLQEVGFVVVTGSLSGSYICISRIVNSLANFSMKLAKHLPVVKYLAMEGRATLLRAWEVAKGRAVALQHNFDSINTFNALLQWMDHYLR